MTRNRTAHRAEDMPAELLSALENVITDTKTLLEKGLDKLLNMPTDAAEWWSMFMEHLEDIIECNEKAETTISADLLRECASKHDHWRASVILSSIVECAYDNVARYQWPSWAVVRMLEHSYDKIYEDAFHENVM